jgi:hypothetical protein
MPTDPVTGQPLPYPGDPDYKGTTRRRRYQPTPAASAELESSPRVPFRPGQNPTSKQQMQRHTYPEFGRATSTEAGAVAAQRAAAGQGQGIVQGPHISEVPPASLEQLLQRLMSSAEQGQKPVQRKPMQLPGRAGLGAAGAAGGALGGAASANLNEIIRAISGSAVSEQEMKESIGRLPGRNIPYAPSSPKQVYPSDAVFRSRATGQPQGGVGQLPNVPPPREFRPEGLILPPQLETWLAGTKAPQFEFDPYRKSGGLKGRKREIGRRVKGVKIPEFWKNLDI